MNYSPYYHYTYPCDITDCYNIKVEGNSTITADPDTATITLGVITEDKNLQNAQIENQKRSNELLAALQKIGISKDDIQTIDYRIEKVYDYIGGERILVGYKVTNRLKITVHNVDEVGKVIDAAVNSGANEVTDVSFSLSDPSLHYRKALSLAVTNAVTKALQIGNTLNVNVNLTPLRLIEEKFEFNYIPRQPAFRTPEGETPIIPQDIKIKAKVLAEFVYAKTRQY